MSQSLADVIDAHAAARPNAIAFFCEGQPFTWAEYATRSDALAGALAGFEPGERIAVQLQDGPDVHAAYVGIEKAGLVAVGIGPRAGEQEARHLVELSGARALISTPRHRDIDQLAFAAELGLEHIALDPWPDAGALDRSRRLGPDELFFLNSTSGTTGLPKCVTHSQARWLYFHELAVEAGELSQADVFCSALPAPFGFGLWTAHFTPTLLGAATVLMPQFSPAAVLEAIERHRVTVLAAVSTQFIQMLNAPELRQRDLESLRALFTGGEAVPYERAAEFEQRTGAVVLQFYGSNETGALSGTTSRDSREQRLRTAGRTIDAMQVRLFDDDGHDVTASGVGQPGCRGAATSQGYYGDPEANRALYTPDGWMLTGDIASIDADGYLRVIGRKADFIIRGGKNISAPAVEAAAGAHPAIALAAAVAMPDPVFGERVCLYTELRPGASLTLEQLVEFLRTQGISKEMFPERLVPIDALPRASGGKIAKQALKDDLAARLQREQAD